MCLTSALMCDTIEVHKSEFIKTFSHIITHLCSVINKGGDKMVINKTKLEFTMAELLINPKELAEKAQISYPAFKRAWEGQGVKIATIGKIAKALGVAVQDIIE